MEGRGLLAAAVLAVGTEGCFPVLDIDTDRWEQADVDTGMDDTGGGTDTSAVDETGDTEDTSDTGDTGDTDVDTITPGACYEQAEGELAATSLAITLILDDSRVEGDELHMIYDGTWNVAEAVPNVKPILGEFAFPDGEFGTPEACFGTWTLINASAPDSKENMTGIFEAVWSLPGCDLAPEDGSDYMQFSTLIAVADPLLTECEGSVDGGEKSYFMYNVGTAELIQF